MLRRDAVKKAKAKAKRVKDIVYLFCDDNYGYQGYFSLTQQEYDNSNTVDESDILAAYDQYGRAC